jgi:hypothetical protein
MVEQELRREGEIVLQKGSRFCEGDSKYSLRNDVAFPYEDWQGACAGVYMEHPWLRKIVNCGPNLNPAEPEQEVREHAFNMLNRMAKVYHQLRSSSANQEAGPELRQLEKFFEVSKTAA